MAEETRRQAIADPAFQYPTAKPRAFEDIGRAEKLSGSLDRRDRDRSGHGLAEGGQIAFDRSGPAPSLPTIDQLACARGCKGFLKRRDGLRMESKEAPIVRRARKIEAGQTFVEFAVDVVRRGF